MNKWIVLAMSCFAFTAAVAQEIEAPVTSSEEVVIEQGSDETAAPSLSNKKDGKGCGCGGGKTK